MTLSFDTRIKPYGRQLLQVLKLSQQFVDIVKPRTARNKGKGKERDEVIEFCEGTLDRLLDPPVQIDPLEETSRDVDDLLAEVADGVGNSSRKATYLSHSSLAEEEEESAKPTRTGSDGTERPQS